MNLVRSIAVAAALAALAGCESIGQGSTIQSLQVLAANGSTDLSPYRISECLRDQLVVLATFTDGTRSDFSYRVTWSSSDDAIVQVSNNEVMATLVSGGVFTQSTNTPYRPGTIIPHGTGTARITATFLGLAASVDVEVGTPVFKIAPVVPGIDPQPQPPATAYLGPTTTQRFAFFITQPDGKSVVSTTLNALGPLNPVLWRFVGGTLDPADSTVTGDFDKYAVPSADNPSATISATSGIVTGLAADAATYQVEAVTSLCPDRATFKPTAPVRVVPFATANPLVLAHEDGINGENVAPTGDLVAGTQEFLEVTANLDTDGDGAGDATQDIGSQADFNLTFTTICNAGETNCTCDTDGSNCTKRLFLSGNNQIFSLVNNDSASVDIYACFTTIDTTHSDDCDKDSTGEQAAMKSGTLALRAIPVDLTGAGATLFARPASPAPQRAFTYPGRQFDAYGTFTALSGTPFAGGTSATGTQKINREVTWTTRPQGSTTTQSDVGFVRNGSDGFFNGAGTFSYQKDVAANTNVDISFAPFTLFTAAPAPSSVPFTICPSTAGTCP